MAAIDEKYRLVLDSVSLVVCNHVYMYSHIVSGGY